MAVSSTKSAVRNCPFKIYKCTCINRNTFFFFFLFLSMKGFVLCDFIAFPLALRCGVSGFAVWQNHSLRLFFHPQERSDSQVRSVPYLP